MLPDDYDLTMAIYTLRITRGSRENRHPLSNVVLWLFCSVSGLSRPSRIDVFEDYVYGTTLDHQVFQVHKYGRGRGVRLHLQVEKASGVLVFHRYKQQDGTFTIHHVQHAPSFDGCSCAP